MIVSASRRTDIPSFYVPWLFNRLKAGYACVRNPMNSRQVTFVPLTPGNVDCIVFWTKDVSPMLPRLPELSGMGFPYYFQFTLTPYENDIERNLPAKTEIIEGFRALSRQIGAHRVIWRYDPVIVSPAWPVSRHHKAFEALCAALEGHTLKCVLSFVDIYRKTLRNAAGMVPGEVSKPDMYILAEGFAHAAKKHGITVVSCSEEEDFGRFVIERGACIDPELIERIAGKPVRSRKDPNQRRFCLCAASTDIGAYDSCVHGCAYCYANVSDKTAIKNRLQHDPQSPFLIGGPRDGDIVTEKKVPQESSRQISLFGE